MWVFRGEVLMGLMCCAGTLCPPRVFPCTLYKAEDWYKGYIAMAHPASESHQFLKRLWRESRLSLVCAKTLYGPLYRRVPVQGRVRSR